MNSLLKLSIISLLAYASLRDSCAQSFSARLWRDTVSVAVGSTFTNRLTVVNQGSRAITFRVHVQVPRSVQFMSSVPQQLITQPGQATIIPLKGLLDQQAGAPTEPITIYLSDSTGRPLEHISFQLNAFSSKRQPVITLYVPDETHILYTTSEPARLPLRLVHQQAGPQAFMIEAQSVPAGLDQTPFPKHVILRSRQDTTIHLLANPIRSWSAHTPYQFIVTVRDTSGSIVGTVTYKVVVAVDTKRYTTVNTNYDDGYGASTALTKLSTNQWAREARLWGADSLGNGHLTFRLHYFDYVNDNFRQMQNSYVSWRTSRTTVHVGSMSDYHEIAMLGRGLKVSINRPTRQWTFWAVNANPDLLNPDVITDWSGNVASVRYDQQITRLPGAAWSLSSSYFTQPTGRAGYLNFAAFRYGKPDRQSLEVLVAQSMELGRQGPERARNAGWAGQLNYSYQRPTFQWQWRSYISSPAYAGYQRGATSLNNYTFWSPAPQTVVLVRFSHLLYDQLRYVSPTNRSRYVYGNTIAELDLSQRFGAVVLGIRPYWYGQTDFSNPASQRASAYRVVPSVTYRGRNRQFALSYDVGRFNNQTAPVTKPAVLSQRITSSGGIGAFSLSGFWQQGPYYLNDFRTEHPDRIRIASLTPAVNFDLFNRRLIGSLGLNYQYDALSFKGKYLAVGRVQFDPTPTFTLRLEGNGTPYAQQRELTYSQYRLELTKRFTQLKLKGQGRLQLRFFEDANGNDRYDAGEEWAEGLLVTVNDNTLMTNAKGAILYQNIPPGTYTVSAFSSRRQGDPILYYEKITVARTVSRLIPLRQTFRVSGRLRCQANAYENKPCELDRFGIDVQREGQKIASTIPLPDGTFALHLVPGTYTVLIRDYGRQVQSTVKTTSFTLSDTGQHPPLDWQLDGSTRNVDIKRFKK